MKSISSQAPQRPGSLARTVLLACLAATPLLTGCTTLLQPIETIPAERIPPQFLAEPQADKVPIDVSRLRQPKPEHYLIDKDDVLGIYIEGILGEIGEAPPVVMPPPEAGSDLPPAVGFPIPVREDGTVSLPLVKPISVRGLNIQQVEQLIMRTYRDGENPIVTEESRIIVTLMRERTYRVFVVRQDNTANANNPIFAQTALSIGVTDRNDQSGRGYVLQMPAYKNDLLNALAQTGGLPGLNAKSDIRILRGNRLTQKKRDEEIEEFYRTHGPEEFPYAQLPAIADESNVVRIPTRIRPTDQPQFRTEDIILRDGDIVYVDSRNTDFFYTGGLLRGGEFLIPRDYDLDVIGAVSLAGGAQLGSGGGFGGFFNGVTGASPTELILLRRLPGQRQVAVRIDLNRAINDPRSRLLVKAGDTLILRYKPQEELANLALGTFFSFGISQLFNR